MALQDEIVFSLNLSQGEPPEWSSAYIPISPKKLDEIKDRELSVYDLAKLAFDNIPSDYIGSRIEIGKRLETFGHGAVLNTFGPVEGDYYIEIPEVQSEQA